MGITRFKCTLLNREVFVAELSDLWYEVCTAATEIPSQNLYDSSLSLNVLLVKV